MFVLNKEYLKVELEDQREFSKDKLKFNKIPYFEIENNTPRAIYSLEKNLEGTYVILTNSGQVRGGSIWSKLHSDHQFEVKGLIFSFYLFQESLSIFSQDSDFSLKEDYITEFTTKAKFKDIAKGEFTQVNYHNWPKFCAVSSEYAHLDDILQLVAAPSDLFIKQ